MAIHSSILPWENPMDRGAWLATVHGITKNWTLLPGKSHGWRSLVGYSPQGRKELDITERLH